MHHEQWSAASVAKQQQAGQYKCLVERGKPNKNRDVSDVLSRESLQAPDSTAAVLHVLVSAWSEVAFLATSDGTVLRNARVCKQDHSEIVACHTSCKGNGVFRGVGNGKIAEQVQKQCVTNLWQPLTSATVMGAPSDVRPNAAATASCSTSESPLRRTRGTELDVTRGPPLLIPLPAGAGDQFLQGDLSRTCRPNGNYGPTWSQMVDVHTPEVPS